MRLARRVLLGSRHGLAPPTCCSRPGIHHQHRQGRVQGQTGGLEAASPVLIEKVRAATPPRTSGNTAVRQPAARHGEVTFSLTGFGGVKREDIELTGSFTATVNTDLKVGGPR